MNDSENSQSQSRIVAAVDLGSNSFHMVIASLEENGSLKIIDTIKEMVRLGAGLDDKNCLRVFRRTLFTHNLRMICVLPYSNLRIL